MAWTTNHLGADGLPPIGYWGPVTASLWWCEDKYRWSKYIAEPFNTFTNVVFIALALHGCYNCYKEKLPRRFILTNAGIAFIGLGSFAFHATLLYECQLLDELPMIYTSLILSYAILETNKRGQSPTGGIWLQLTLIGVALLITAGYLILPNPILHQVAYGLIQFASTCRVFYHLYASNSPLNQTKEGQIKRKMMRTSYNYGALIFIAGFAIWNVDNIFCDQLRRARGFVGYPLAALLEGHAWWHILTGYGAYHLVVCSSMLASSLKESPAHFTLKDHDTFQGFWLPRVIRTKEWKGVEREKEITGMSGNGRIDSGTRANGKLVNGKKSQ